jgi:hypothetical protein
MSWDWVAGHVRSKSQNDVIQAVRKLAEVATDGNLRPAEIGNVENTTHNFSPLVFLTVASYQSKGWLTFWNGARRFVSWIFNVGRFSGILFHGNDHLSGNPASESWDYTLWEDGSITDWYISNPEYEFMEWGLEALESIVVPYLRKKEVNIEVGDTTPMNRRTVIQSVIRKTLHVFQPHVASLQKCLDLLVPLDVVDEWHTLSAIDAMYEIPRVFDLPFAGPDYNIVDLAVYLDILRGKISPPHDLYYLNLAIRGAERYERESSWKNAVSECVKHFETTRLGNY